MIGSRDSWRRAVALAASALLTTGCLRESAVPASTSGHGAGDGASGSFDAIPKYPQIVRADHMLRGVSLAGADFGEKSLPGTFGKDYVYPDAAYAHGYASPAYFRQKGMTIFRLPFRWERLQPERNHPFDAAELERLQTTVKDLRALGAKVLLDPHNYARYGNDTIGSAEVPVADFVDFWKRLATLYKDDPEVMFGLVNEPHDMKSEQWRDDANAAIAGIRETGAKNTIFVPGNGWTGAHSWAQDWYGTPNAALMLTIKDPADNLVFEVHQYLDGDSSGTGDKCSGPLVGLKRLKPFVDWAKENRKRGFLGEFAGGANPTCEAATQNLLNYVESNPDVFVGWTWWAAGPWWGDSLRILEPKDGVDAAQMRWLEPRLK